MRNFIVALALGLIATPALATSYFPVADLASGYAQSAVEAGAMGVPGNNPSCTPNCHDSSGNTLPISYWWVVQSIPAGGIVYDQNGVYQPSQSCLGGTYLVMENAPRNTQYDFTSQPVNPTTGQKTGITDDQKASLVPGATMVSLGCLPGGN